MPLYGGKSKPREAQGKAINEASLIFMKLLTFVFLPSLILTFCSCHVLSCLDYILQWYNTIISHSLPMRNLLLQLLYVVTKGHMNYHNSLASKFRDIKSIFKNQDIAE